MAISEIAINRPDPSDLPSGPPDEDKKPDDKRRGPPDKNRRRGPPDKN